MSTPLHSALAASTDISFRAQPSRATDSCLRFAARTAVIVVGFIRLSIERYPMNPDGIRYLDLGDAFFHRKMGAGPA
jgi:hypothetical protein